MHFFAALSGTHSVCHFFIGAKVIALALEGNPGFPTTVWQMVNAGISRLVIASFLSLQKLHAGAFIMVKAGHQRFSIHEASAVAAAAYRIAVKKRISRVFAFLAAGASALPHDRALFIPLVQLFQHGQLMNLSAGKVYIEGTFLVAALTGIPIIPQLGGCSHYLFSANASA